MAESPWVICSVRWVLGVIPPRNHDRSSVGIAREQDECARRSQQTRLRVYVSCAFSKPTNKRRRVSELFAFAAMRVHGLGTRMHSDFGCGLGSGYVRTPGWCAECRFRKTNAIIQPMRASGCELQAEILQGGARCGCDYVELRRRWARA